jgi:hypothetical protein
LVNAIAALSRQGRTPESDSVRLLVPTAINSSPGISANSSMIEID